MQRFYKKNTGLLLIITAVLIVLVSMAWIRNVLRQTGGGGGTRSATAEGTAYQYHIAAISDDHSGQFWDAVYQEARKTGKEKGIYVEEFGEALSSDYSKEELIEMATLAKVDGILIETENPGGLEGYIKKASAQGIPVMTLLNDVANSERIGFVSCDNYGMGEMYGNQIRQEAELRLEAGGRQDKIQVTLLMNLKEESTAANIIYSGIREALEPLKDKVEVSVALSADDRFDSEETVHELIVGNSTPDIIACLGSIDTVSVYQSVVEYNKVGEVAILGYYYSEDILDGIEKGIIRSTIAVDAGEMGRTAIEGFCQYFEKEYVSEYLPVSAELITAENVAQYREEEH